MMAVIAVGGFYYPELWLKETTDARNKRIFRDLPFYLDIIILAVESGTNFTGGLTQAVQKAPDGPLRFEFGRVLRDIRAGKSRAEALRELTVRVSSDGLKNVVSSIIQAEKTGSSLGAVLRAQAENLRNTRFLKAEKMAMEAPVKLLGPLIMSIFPNTFLVIGFVILSQALHEKWGHEKWGYVLLFALLVILCKLTVGQERGRPSNGKAATTGVCWGALQRNVSWRSARSDL